MLSANSTASIDSEGDVTAGGNGIQAISTGGTSTATASVKQKGNVTSTGGKGIYVQSANGTASLESEGTITAGGHGIQVISTGDTSTATASVKQTGDVTSSGGKGIYVQSANGAASLESHGAIDASDDGIFVKSTGNSSLATASVDHSGDVVSSSGRGIFVLSTNAAASLESAGSIEAYYDGIFVKSSGDESFATASIDHTGNITSIEGYGIFAESARQGVVVDSSGNIVAKLDGIHAISKGSDAGATVAVTHEGDITSSDGAAVYASATNQGVTVTTEGDLSGKTGGIVARSTGDETGGDVQVTHTGDITTEEGSGISAYASRRDVVVVQDGDVSGGDYGISAQSEGGKVDVTVDGGTISDALIAAVSLQSITGANLENHGTIDGDSGLAVKSKGYGGTTVTNYGTLIGDVVIDDTGLSSVINQTGGVYDITELTFTGGGTLTNHGTLSPGGDGVVHTASVTGNFVQSSDGILLIDVDSDSADLIDVSGSAEMTGSLQLNFIDLSSGTVTGTVLTSSGLTASDIQLLAGIAVYRSSVSVVDGTDLVFDVDLSFVPDGLSENGNEIATALNNAFESDAAEEMGPLLAALANLPTVEAYEEALTQLSPEVYAQNTNATQTTTQTFADRMLSCRVQNGAYAFNAEGECAWFNVGATRFDRQATDTTLAYGQNSATYSMGVQMAIDADWRFGVGAGYTQSEGQNSLGATNSRDQLQAGAIVKYDHEATVLAASLTAGLTNTETVRPVTIGGYTDIVTGKSPSSFLAARLHAAYTADLGGTYIRPLAELNLMHIETAAYSETGGPSALNVMASGQTSLSFDPALELGAELPLGEGTVIRPYLRAGLSKIIGTDQRIVASFVDGDGTTFAVDTSADSLLGKVSLGADVLGLGDTTLRLYYDGTFGATSAQHGVGMKFGANF